METAKANLVWPSAAELAVGGLLLLAAALKAYSFTVSMMTGKMGSAWMVLAIIVELGIGTWLVSGFAPVAARLAACALFIVFLNVSISDAAVSSKSCGCFGFLAVPPVYVISFDAAALLALLSGFLPAANRSGPCAGHPVARPFRSLATFAVLVAFMPIILIGAQYEYSRPPKNAVSSLESRTAMGAGMEIILLFVSQSGLQWSPDVIGDSDADRFRYFVRSRDTQNLILEQSAKEVFKRFDATPNPPAALLEDFEGGLHLVMGRFKGATDY